jgi:hypothetical protein
MAAPISAIGSGTPVLECTQVSATTRVRSVTACVSREVIASADADAGSSYSRHAAHPRAGPPLAQPLRVLGGVEGGAEVVGRAEHVVTHHAAA